MIARIEGELVGVDQSGKAYIRVGSLLYELLIPVWVVEVLGARRGEVIALSTLHYFESHGQGSTFIPRLVGFISDHDRAFFELFTTVKGIGNRKALRAMAMPSVDIARAIANRDTQILMTLPEIGRKLAETIITELCDKAGKFTLEPSTDRLTLSMGNFPSNGSAAPPASTPMGNSMTAQTGRAFVHDALAVLLQLGEPRQSAVNWIDRALVDDPHIPDVKTLVAAAFSQKNG